MGREGAALDIFLKKSALINSVGAYIFECLPRL